MSTPAASATSERRSTRLRSQGDDQEYQEILLLELPDSVAELSDEKYQEFKSKFSKLKEEFRKLRDRVQRLQDSELSRQLSESTTKTQELKLVVQSLQEQYKAVTQELEELRLQHETVKADLDKTQQDLLDRTLRGGLQAGQSNLALQLANERLKTIKVLADDSLQTHNDVARQLAQIWPNLVVKENQSFTTTASDEAPQLESRDNTPVTSFNDQNRLGSDGVQARRTSTARAAGTTPPKFDLSSDRSPDPAGSEADQSKTSSQQDSGTDSSKSTVESESTDTDATVKDVLIQPQAAPGPVGPGPAHVDTPAPSAGTSGTGQSGPGPNSQQNDPNSSGPNTNLQQNDPNSLSSGQNSQQNHQSPSNAGFNMETHIKQEEGIGALARLGLAGSVSKFNGVSKYNTPTAHLSELQDWFDEKQAEREAEGANSKIVDFSKAWNKVLRFKQSITGKARDWFEAQDFHPSGTDGKWTDEDWSKIQTAFKNQFSSDGIGRIEQLQTFQNLKWKKGENVQEFAMRVETLGKKLNKSKDDQMLAFIMGMPVTLQNQLIIKDGTTMRDLIMIVSQQLKIKERMRERGKTFDEEDEFDLMSRTPLTKDGVHQGEPIRKAKPEVEIESSPKIEPHTEPPTREKSSTPPTREAASFSAIETPQEFSRPLHTHAHEKLEHQLKVLQNELKNLRAQTQAPQMGVAETMPTSFNMLRDKIVKDRRNEKVLDKLDELTTNQKVEEAQNQMRFSMIASGLNEFSRSNFHPGGGQQYQNNRNNFQNRRNGGGNWNNDRDNRSGGRPTPKIHKKEFDVPNAEQWKEFIKKGWCPLHGFRGGKSHTVKNCRELKKLIELGKIVLNAEDEITTGQGTRISLNSE